jgi:hypothetical protein
MEQQELCWAPKLQKPAPDEAAAILPEEKKTVLLGMA